MVGGSMRCVHEEQDRPPDSSHTASAVRPADAIPRDERLEADAKGHRSALRATDAAEHLKDNPRR